jgi:glycosyltransferase involved in cell wall biosynthesis
VANEVLVTVVLPCLNEEDSVGQCISEALSSLAAAGYPAEVLVVDNNSTDRSADVARSRGARVIRERRPGYGNAVRAGIQAARGKIVVMADADLTYDLTRIAQLIRPVDEGRADIVVGERLSEASTSTMSFLHRHVGTPALTHLIRRATNDLTITDSQSGYRAFDRDAVLSLGLTAPGMEFASEMLIRASLAGLRIIETSAGYRVRIGESKLNTFSDGWRHVRKILSLSPHLMLVAPGALLAVLGLALQVVGLVLPSGFSVGSLRWQPSFISGIFLVVGIQALVGGLAVMERRRMSPGESTPQTGSRPSLAAKSLAIGLVLGFVGGGIDAGLFVLWLVGDHTFTRELVLAAMAQSAVIDGVTLTGFGLIYPILVRQWDARSSELAAESTYVPHATKLTHKNGRP